MEPVDIETQQADWVMKWLEIALVGILAIVLFVFVPTLAAIVVGLSCLFWVLWRGLRWLSLRVGSHPRTEDRQFNWWIALVFTAVAVLALLV